MNNTSNQLIINLSPDSLSAGFYRRNEVRQAERIDLNPGEWEGLWSDGLMCLDQPLRQLISRFSKRSVQLITLIYQSPTLNQQVYTFDLPSSASIEAAKSKFRESIGYKDAIEAVVLNHSAKSDNATTVLVYSDREEQLTMIYAWLNRCQVRVSSLVPASTATMVTAGEVAQSVEEGTAIFYIGSDVSVMAYASQDGLHLIRSADIGYQKLAEAYHQVFGSSRQGDSSCNDSGSEHESCLIEASKMLFEYGIPVDSTMVDGVELRSELLPLLAPVLQRFCIEVKQTFRFGLNGLDLPKSMLLCGPGSTIPSISKTIAHHIEMNIRISPSNEGFNPADPFGRGCFENDVFEHRNQINGLLPEIAHTARKKKTISNAVAVGLMIASLGVAGEYAYHSFELQKIENKLSNAEPRVRTVNAFQDQLIEVSKASGMISEISQLVSTTVDSVPRWHDVLASLNQTSSETIQISDIRGAQTPDSSDIDINGIVVTDSAKQSDDSLNVFINDLRSIEGVDSVSLGATSRVSMDEDKWGRQFTITIHLVNDELPYQSLVHSVSDNFETGAP
jgi:hypothetical protein